MANTVEEVEYEEGIQSETLAYERVVRLRSEAVQTNKNICDRSMVVIGVAVALCSAFKIDLTTTISTASVVLLIISGLAAVAAMVFAGLVAVPWNTINPGEANFQSQWDTVASGPSERAIEQLLTDEIASYARELEIIDGRRKYLNREMLAAWVQVVAFMLAVMLK